MDTINAKWHSIPGIFWPVIIIKIILKKAKTKFINFCRCPVVWHYKPQFLAISPRQCIYHFRWMNWACRDLNSKIANPTVWRMTSAPPQTCTKQTKEICHHFRMIWPATRWTRQWLTCVRCNNGRHKGRRPSSCQLITAAKWGTFSPLALIFFTSAVGLMLTSC